MDELQRFEIRREAFGPTRTKSWAAYHNASGSWELKFSNPHLAQFLTHLAANSVVDTARLGSGDFKTFYQGATEKQLRYCDCVRPDGDSKLWPGSLTELVAIDVEMRIDAYFINDIVTLAENVPVLEFAITQAVDVLFLLNSLKNARPQSGSGMLYLSCITEISPSIQYQQYFFEKLYQELQEDFPFTELFLRKPYGVKTRQMKTFAKRKIQSTLRLVWMGYEDSTVAFCQGDGGGVIVLAKTLREYRAWEHTYTLRLQLCRNSSSNFHRLQGELRRSLQEFL